MSGSSNAMKFVSPEMYAKSQESHFAINSDVVNQFVETFGPLDENDRVLDYGSGTGETTAALAKGTLENLGKPGVMIGSDLSQAMVDYCKAKYHLENLNFHQLDVTAGEEFGKDYSDSFSLVTSFCCLHWVSDHPAAAKLTHQILKQGGKFLHLVPAGHNEQKSHCYRIFNEMKEEIEWKNILKHFRWKTFMTKHVNKDWSSSIDDRGYGPLIVEDYKRLMEGSGFRVALAKSYPLCFNVTKEIVEATHKVIYEAFDELTEKDRNAFLSEYRQRVEAAHVSDENGLFELHFDGFIIIGEKI